MYLSASLIEITQAYLIYIQLLDIHTIVPFIFLGCNRDGHKLLWWFGPVQYSARTGILRVPYASLPHLLRALTHSLAVVHVSPLPSPHNFPFTSSTSGFRAPPYCLSGWPYQEQGSSVWKLYQTRLNHQSALCAYLWAEILNPLNVNLGPFNSKITLIVELTEALWGSKPHWTTYYWINPYRTLLREDIQYRKTKRICTRSMRINEPTRGQHI